MCEQIGTFLICAEGKKRAQFENVITNNFIDTEVTLEALTQRCFDLAKLQAMAGVSGADRKLPGQIVKFQSAM